MTDGKIFKLNKKQTDENPFLKEPPKEAEGSDAYIMSDVHYTHVPLKTKHDLESGGIRNKRWGAVMSVGIIPGLNESPQGPAVLPMMPSQFFDADSIDALRARLIFELEKALELAKLQVDSPEKFEQYQKDYLTSVRAEQEERVR